ncbi:MAG: DUF3810 domain-containing protein [Lachnospiraceae bacterium]|nr:DUF3810 domain-containing protein [Lachnospiraceae bacterium]
MKKLKKWKIIIPAVLILFSVLLNSLARLSPEFSNYYVNHIFPLWVETYGRVTGLFPFSVGEWMLYLAVCLVVLLVLTGFITLIGRRKLPAGWKRGCKRYALFLYWVFGIVCVIMALNCFMLYQVPAIPERFDFGGKSGREYGAEELGILRDYVAEQANELAVRFERDEKGYILYDMDMEAEAIAQMKGLKELIPNLGGYYPRPKKLFCSGFYSQQYIMGYYFPFSMEANYNQQMYITNMPVNMCHELSHLKGFILEDEANFVGYLASARSEDILFRYSAMLSVIGYLDRDFAKAVGRDSAEYQSRVPISELAAFDRMFLTKEAWQQVEKNAVLDTETVSQAADTFLNTTLTLNGVSDGTVSYSRVVKLLLWYYDGILY